jgi:hypothetical protein
MSRNFKWFTIAQITLAGVFASEMYLFSEELSTDFEFEILAATWTLFTVSGISNLIIGYRLNLLDHSPWRTKIWATLSLTLGGLGLGVFVSYIVPILIVSII